MAVWVLVTVTARSQRFSEWFRQNSTRLKYYAKQVAALQVSLSELDKGYGIAEMGLGLITEGKQGEWDVHDIHYKALGEINPAVAGMGETGEIVVMQAAIIKRFTDALERYGANGVLGTDGRAQVRRVTDAVVQAGLLDIKELTMVLTAHAWQMTDDERMVRIEALDRKMKERYAFTMSFTGWMDAWEGQLMRERGALETLRTLYGIR